MQAIKASDYSYRKVVVACLNPNEPKWVHIAGEQQRDANGQPMKDAITGAPMIQRPDLPPGTRYAADSSHSGDTEEAKAMGQPACHNCRYNWQTREFIWEGRRLYKQGPDGKLVMGPNGQPVLKTSDDLAAEIKAAVAVSAPPTPVPMVITL